jgi:hypothetical protein
MASWTQNALLAAALHSNRWSLPIYSIQSVESRIIAGLHAVERTTSIVAQGPMMASTLQYSIPLSKNSLYYPSRDNALSERKDSCSDK